MWFWYQEEDFFLDDDSIDTGNAEILRAMAMRQEGEMNHWIPREERCRIIAEADRILWHWQEDYRD